MYIKSNKQDYILGGDNVSNASNNYFFLGNRPYICKLCGEPVTDNMRVCGWRCHNCSPKYELFLKDVPQYWKDLLGNTGMDPLYEEWIEEAYIQARLESGEISLETAEEESKELAIKIMRHYQPWQFSDYQVTAPDAKQPSVLSTIRLDQLTI